MVSLLPTCVRACCNSHIAHVRCNCPCALRLPCQHVQPAMVQPTKNTATSTGSRTPLRSCCRHGAHLCAPQWPQQRRPCALRLPRQHVQPRALLHAQLHARQPSHQHWRWCAQLQCKKCRRISVKRATTQCTGVEQGSGGSTQHYG
jgi:hypothetical protein